MARWLLPENISDVLPEEARSVERLRRSLLDLFRGYGYELVIPPLLEHLESLLTGSGHDLGLTTLKLVDQLSGRTLGLRADTTPQVARIDSHILNRAGVARLCYAGSTLHARPMHPLASREPMQIGAEIYGDADFGADIEVLELAVRSARVIGNTHVQIDLGHTGVVRALLGNLLQASAGVEDVLAALTGKDPAALHAASQEFEPQTQRALHSLMELNGGREVLEQAQRELPRSAALDAALEELAQLAQACGADEVSIDLADLHGFRYHTGATFAAYVTGLSGPLLRGGRYDDIGQAFGRARPATGFSLLDLREAAQLAAPCRVRAIRAPRAADPKLDAIVEELRTRGEVVIRAGAVGDLGVALTVDRELVWHNGTWSVRELPCAPGVKMDQPG
ncbi:MAG TPA: ATP phosphoribosyltransferase regulatory subunit [Isosphaeraceae bacterium]|nr:ATP phosphoribosyltransferase regulatory subunit [Isosphaeraceae bacterium]